MLQNLSCWGYELLMFKATVVIPQKKPAIVCRKHHWYAERVWVESHTIHTTISKETKKFLRIVIGSSAVDLLLKTTSKTRGSNKGAVLGMLNNVLLLTIQQLPLPLTFTFVENTRDCSCCPSLLFCW